MKKEKIKTIRKPRESKNLTKKEFESFTDELASILVVQVEANNVISNLISKTIDSMNTLRLLNILAIAMAISSLIISSVK